MTKQDLDARSTLGDLVLEAIMQASNVRIMRLPPSADADPRMPP